jgi:hypothetical protein
MLSPAATYHAELREQLGSVGRALSMQRGLVWLARGLAAGTGLVLGLVIWAWARDSVAILPLVGLLALPIGTALLAAVGSMFIRHTTPDLARRVDSAARLQERSTTALELGARGVEFPLALAQMRDAVEHLRRVDMLEAFPLRVPRNELVAAFFVAVVAALVAISPNPWLLRARAANPAITIAREQAQRVQRLADSLSPQDSSELEQLRQLVTKGARTIDARSNEPDAALNALQDLEEQVRQMGAGDDQLAAALAAIASALASDPTTQNLASAINTGDMREISKALQDLSQQAPGLSGQDQQRVAKVLRDASGRAGRVSQSVAGELSDAADSLGGADSADGESSDQQGDGTTAQNGRSASDALKQLSQSAAAAGERQRAASQLESSRNALERALGRTQSRSGSNSTGRSSSSSNNSRSQGNSGQPGGDQSQSGGQGQGGGDQGDGTDANSGGSPGSDQGNGGDTGQGGGFSNGGQNQNRSNAGSGLDAITTPQQVPSYGGVTPDESSTNPYLGEAGDSAARAQDESVQPSFSRKPTQGNDSGSIPLGLRDLVKDYFSSLDQNQK